LTSTHSLPPDNKYEPSYENDKQITGNECQCKYDIVVSFIDEFKSVYKRAILPDCVPNAIHS